MMTAYLATESTGNPLVDAAKDGDVSKLQELIATGQYDLEKRSREYGSPLHATIFEDHLEAAKVLLSAGADPESYAPDGFGYYRFTSLMLAAKMGKRDITKLLWDRNPGKGIRSSEEMMSALELACTYGFGDIVRDFLLWWDGWETEICASGLRLAACRWNDGAIEALTENRNFDQKALDCALFKAADMKMIMDETGSLPYTPTDRAKQAKTLELLIDAGANPNAEQEQTMRRVIHIATVNAETIGGLRLLLRKHANVNAVNSMGETALFYALYPVPNRKAFVRGRMVPNTEIVKILLENGADVDIHGQCGRTPLHIAAFYGPLSQFQTCLEKSSHPWPKTNRGATLLHEAAAGNQTEIVQQLLSDGADANEVTSDLWAAILFAMQSRRKKNDILNIVQVLIDHGADVNAANQLGWTALHRTADLYGFETCKTELAEVVELLLLHNANTELLASIPSWLSQSSDRQTEPGFPVGHRLTRFIKIDNEDEEVVKDLTPLHWASDTGSLTVVSTLLRHGSNACARDANDATPAIRAAKSRDSAPGHNNNTWNKQQTMKLLLGAGDSFEREDATGVSVSTWAQNRGLSSNYLEW